MDNEIHLSTYQNPGSKAPLELRFVLTCNTSDETIARNISINSAHDHLAWLKFEDPHDGEAIIVGGGPSAENDLLAIRHRQRMGGTVFSLNGASRWLRQHGIRSDWQVMIDAKPETLSLVDQMAPNHLFASQVDPSTVDAVSAPVLMHLSSEGSEDYLPKERRDSTSYALVGGGYGVGNSACCAAYVMGFRTIHCFGFDCSHDDGRSHSYSQPMNDGIPCVLTEWGGEVYLSTVAMKAAAERFQVIANDLIKLGCEMHVHGTGLLPAMYRNPTPNRDLSER